MQRMFHAMTRCIYRAPTRIAGLDGANCEAENYMWNLDEKIIPAVGAAIRIISAASCGVVGRAGDRLAIHRD